MPDLLSRFLSAFLEIQGPSHVEKVLAGVSGGPDSMALADLLRRSGLLGAVAHVNYNLRAESCSEQELVEAWAISKDVPFYCHQADPATAEGESVQLWARDIRYEFFEKCLQDTGLAFCALGHHADDQVETVLFRLLRSRNLNPLAGIPVKRGKYIRPLLGISKQDILDYCNEQSLEFAIDSSNDKLNYVRNQIRHSVLPVLQTINPSISQRLVEASADLGEVFKWMQGKFESYGKSCISKQPEGFYFLPQVLAKMDAELNPRLFLHVWLGKLGVEGSEIRRVLDDFDSRTGSRWLFKIGVLQKEVNGWLWIPDEWSTSICNIDLNGGENLRLRVDGWEVIVENVALDAAEWVFEPGWIHLDADKIKWPLLVRNARDEDKMVALGRKTVTDVHELIQKSRKSGLIVTRLPLIVVDGEGNVAGIQGGKVSERFKLEPHSVNCLRIHLGWKETP